MPIDVEINLVADMTRHGLRPFQWKPAKAGWTTVHEWLSYHQLKLAASMPVQSRSLIVISL